MKDKSIIIIASALSIVAIVVTTSLFIFVNSSPTIPNRIADALIQELPNSYEVTYDSVDVGLFPPQISFQNLKIKLNQKDSLKNEEGILEVKLGKASFINIKLLEYFTNNKLEIHQINSEGIEMKLMGSITNNETNGQKSNLPFNLVYLDSIRLSKISFSYYTSTSDSLPKLHFPEAQVLVHSLRYDLKEKDLNSKSYQMEILDAEYHQNSGLHLMRANKFLLSSSHKKAIIDSLQIIPKIKASQLSKHTTYKKDIISLLVPHSNISNVDFDHFIDSGKLEAGSIFFDQPRFELYSDKTLPQKEKKRTFPSEMLADVKDIITLDSVVIKNGYIKYYELKKQSEQPGYVTFEKLNAVIQGVTNHKKSKIKATAYLMGNGLLETEIFFPFSFHVDTFSVKGSLGQMPLSQFNPMTTQVAQVEIIKGSTEKMLFEFSANKNFSSGFIYFYYSDLKLSFLEKEKGRKGLIKKIVSTIANMAVFNSNPRNKKFRIGEIHFIREEPKSIFNYWWKSLMTGIESSVMVRNNKK